LKDKDGRVFDRIIDMVYEPLHDYIVEGRNLTPEADRKHRREFRDIDAAKLLEIFLCYWGNILAICQYGKESKNQNQESRGSWTKLSWHQTEGRKLVRRLKEYRDLLAELDRASVTSSRDIQEVLNKISKKEEEILRLYKSITSDSKNKVKGVGDIAFAKTIFLLTSGAVPMFDEKIKECIDGQEYLDSIRKLLKLALVCLEDETFRKKLEERKNLLTGSGLIVSRPRTSVLKALDEGLWRLLHIEYSDKESDKKEERNAFCNGIRQLVKG